jgi:hypothetical protein
VVAIGVLPHRDERMIQLQRWSDEIIARRGDAEERSVLHRFAVWHVIRRLRGRICDADATHGQVVVGIVMGLPLLLHLGSTMRCGEAKTIGQNAEKIRAGVGDPQ